MPNTFMVKDPTDLSSGHLMCNQVTSRQRTPGCPRDVSTSESQPTQLLCVLFISLDPLSTTLLFGPALSPAQPDSTPELLSNL